MSEDRKNEPPFGLSMGFGEAIERFTLVRPSELKPSKHAKKKKSKKKDDDIIRKKDVEVKQVRQ